MSSTPLPTGKALNPAVVMIVGMYMLFSELLYGTLLVFLHYYMGQAPGQGQPIGDGLLWGASAMTALHLFGIIPAVILLPRILMRPRPELTPKGRGVLYFRNALILSAVAECGGIWGLLIGMVALQKAHSLTADTGMLVMTVLNLVLAFFLKAKVIPTAGRMEAFVNQTTDGTSNATEGQPLS